jgi:hypothetical protein
MDRLPNGLPNTEQESSSNAEFVERLQKLAGEQHKLMEHSIFPDWFGPVNTAIATNALPFVLAFSFVIAMLLFVIFFHFFFGLEARFA